MADKEFRPEVSRPFTDGSARSTSADQVYLGGVLTQKHHSLVAAIVETIIPATNTPGAIEAKVPDFIDHVLADWYFSDERRAFVEGLEKFETCCQQKCGRPFESLSESERLVYLEALESEAVSGQIGRLTDLSMEPSQDLVSGSFFAVLKDLALIGYYTSQVGMEAIGDPGPRRGPVPPFGPMWC